MVYRKQDKTNDRKVSKGEKQEGWEMVSCIMCGGSGKRGIRSCELCKGTGIIKVLQ